MKKCGFEFKKDYNLVPSTSEFFFRGQQFDVVLKGQKIGCLGVVNPRVLKNFGWTNPTSMWELDLAPLEKCYSDLFK